MARALDVASVIAGEAVSGTREERIADMRAIASVIANRAQMLGVTPQEVISNQNEFNAYGQSLPPGVNQEHIDLAQEAMDYVAEHGPTTNATFYATPAASDNLPNGLNYEGATTGHQYFSDPQSRAIGTSLGYVQPNEFAFAASPANVPAPGLIGADERAGLLSAYASTPKTEDPFSSLLGQPSSWGLNKDVVPAPVPTVETWSDMAAANPVQAPMGSVQATGLLGAAPDLEASAKAQPDLSVPASPAAISQADVDRAFFNATGANQFDPSFTAGLLGPSNPVVPTAVESTTYTPDTVPTADDIASSRFATPAKTSRIGQLPGLTDTARLDPLSGAIDPATNTNSFLDAGKNLPITQADVSRALFDVSNANIEDGLSDRMVLNSPIDPNWVSSTTATKPIADVIGTPQIDTAPANVSSFADAYAAQRGPNTGLLSANSQIVQGLAEKQLYENQQAGLLAAPTTTTTITPTATPEQQAAGYGLLGNTGMQAGLTNLSGGNLQDINLSGEVVPTKPYSPVVTEDVQTVEAADTPTETVATVDGPASTPAIDQQQDKAVSKAKDVVSKPAATKTSLASKLGINKGSITGGILGSLAAGPVGGVIGGLLGNAVNQNGGLSGLLGSGFSAPTTQIAGGMSNIAGLYGGAFAPGTYAVASNGATVTAQPGGWTSYTNAQGITNMISPSGQQSAYFGGKPTTPTDQDEDADVDAT